MKSIPVAEHVTLRLYASGIASVANGSLGIGHSCYANIDRTGSVRGMKALGHWGRDDRVVRAGGFIYNVERVVVDDRYDKLAALHTTAGAAPAWCLAHLKELYEDGLVDLQGVCPLTGRAVSPGNFSRPLLEQALAC